jgi:hypothetical protein
MGRSTVEGPFVYENWKSAVEDADLQSVQEYPLFTDAYVLGQIQEGYGPYQLFNSIPIPPDSGRLLPVVILRLESYLTYEPPSMDETDTGRYHGGMLSDEIAAIVSLCLGIRLKAGGISRVFDLDGDPKGRPVGFRAHSEPILDKPTGLAPILPRALEPRSLTKIEPMANLLHLSPTEAMALVRAARLYQDAMWIGESAPELSWMMFVSAVEIAASYWYTDSRADVEILEEFKPEFVEELNEIGGAEAIRIVADEFASHLRAAKKFREFIANFAPDPPQERPEHGRFSWRRRNIKQAMVKIYDWRSRALHGGIAFPQPMCDRPRLREEKPLGLASSTRGGVWVAKDVPMLLHTFEYIVRKALLKWWSTMISSDSAA